MKRYAIIKNAESRKQLESYLPANYEVIYEFDSADGYRYDEHDNPIQPPLRTHNGFVIAGEDHAGWTFEDYVRPRLASGLIYATEIDLSHPIMKNVPTGLNVTPFDRRD